MDDSYGDFLKCLVSSAESRLIEKQTSNRQKRIGTQLIQLPHVVEEFKSRDCQTDFSCTDCVNKNITIGTESKKRKKVELLLTQASEQLSSALNDVEALSSELEQERRLRLTHTCPITDANLQKLQMDHCDLSKTYLDLQKQFVDSKSEISRLHAELEHAHTQILKLKVENTQLHSHIQSIPNPPPLVSLGTQCGEEILYSVASSQTELAVSPLEPCLNCVLLEQAKNAISCSFDRSQVELQKFTTIFQQNESEADSRGIPFAIMKQRMDSLLTELKIGSEEKQKLHAEEIERMLVRENNKHEREMRQVQAEWESEMKTLRLRMENERFDIQQRFDRQTDDLKVEFARKESQWALEKQKLLRDEVDAAESSLRHLTRVKQREIYETANDRILHEVERATKDAENRALLHQRREEDLRNEVKRLESQYEAEIANLRAENSKRLSELRQDSAEKISETADFYSKRISILQEDLTRARLELSEIRTEQDAEIAKLQRELRLEWELRLNDANSKALSTMEEMRSQYEIRLKAQSEKFASHLAEELQKRESDSKRISLLERKNREQEAKCSEMATAVVTAELEVRTAQAATAVEVQKLAAENQIVFEEAKNEAQRNLEEMKSKWLRTANEQRSQLEVEADARQRRLEETIMDLRRQLLAACATRDRDVESSVRRTEDRARAEIDSSLRLANRRIAELESNLGDLQSKAGRERTELVARLEKRLEDSREEVAQLSCRVASLSSQLSTAEARTARALTAEEISTRRLRDLETERLRRQRDECSQTVKPEVDEVGIMVGGDVREAFCQTVLGVEMRTAWAQTADDFVEEIEGDGRELEFDADEKQEVDDGFWQDPKEEDLHFPPIVQRFEQQQTQQKFRKSDPFATFGVEGDDGMWTAGGDFVGDVDSRFIKSFLNRNSNLERRVREEKEKRNVWQALFNMDV